MNSKASDVSEGVVSRLRELLAAADVLPLAYRPWQYDDWGTIRGGGTDQRDESLHFIASVRDSRVDHDVFPQHRAAKTDPYDAVTKLFVEGLNALPGLLDIAEATLSPPLPVERLAREALDDLQQAEAEYRLMHDRHGDGSQAAGRAWDLMRRAGDKARAALSALPLDGGL